MGQIPIARLYHHLECLIHFQGLMNFDIEMKKQYGNVIGYISSFFDTIHLDSTTDGKMCYYCPNQPSISYRINHLWSEA